MHFSAIYLIIKIIIFKKSTSNVALYIKPSTKAFTIYIKADIKWKLMQVRGPNTF